MIGTTINPKTLGDVQGLLELIRNPDQYEEAIKNLTDLQDGATKRLLAAEQKERDIAGQDAGFAERELLLREAEAAYDDKVAELKSVEEGLALREARVVAEDQRIESVKVLLSNKEASIDAAAVAREEANEAALAAIDKKWDEVAAERRQLNADQSALAAEQEDFKARLAALKKIAG